MKIKCFRCGKEIDTPDALNADYIIASDAIVKEKRQILYALRAGELVKSKRNKMTETITVKQPKEILYALQENEITRDKRAKMSETEIIKDPETGEEAAVLKYPDLKIEDTDYNWIEIENWEDHRKISNIEKVMIRTEDRDIQIPKYPDITISDDDYTRIEVSSVEECEELPDIEKVIAQVEDRDIQKTAVVCPECYKPTDFVIWGIHENATTK